MAVVTPRNIRNIFIYLIPKFVGYGLYFITLPILTRLLAPEDFGIVALVWIFPTIAVHIFTLGIIFSPERCYFKYRTRQAELNSYFFSTQLFLFICLIISSAIVFVLKGFIAKAIAGNSTYGFAFFVGYLSFFLSQIVGFLLMIYKFMEKAALFSTFTLLQAVITSLASVLFVWLFRMSYMGIIYGSLLGSSAACLIILWYFNKQTKGSFSGKVLLGSITYGLQLVPKTLSGFINRIFDKYMLANMFSLSAVGIYSIGQNIGNSLSLLMSSVSSSFYPICSKEVFDKGEAGSANAGRLFTIFSYLALAPVLLLILFAQEIIYIVAPAAYYKAIDIIVIISGVMASFIFGKYVGVQYAYTNKAYLSFPITLAAALINVLANIILIPRLGLYGAALSMLISAWVSNGLAAFIGQKLYRMQYEWKTIIALQVNVYLAVIAILLLRAMSVSVIPLYLAKMFFLISFCIIGVKARILTRENARMIPSIFAGAGAS